MKKQFVKVENFRKLAIAAESLKGYQSLERFGLLHGFTGTGKTTAIAYLCNQTNGIYIRARRSWTPTSMLKTICSELCVDSLPYCDQMVNLIVRELNQEQRILFIDEADYLFNERKLLDLLRDVHDLSTNPIFLVGMEEIERKLSKYPQLSRRTTHFVKFQPISFEDAGLVARTCCEVKFGERLLRWMYTDSKGNIGLLSVALERVENYAILHGLTFIDIDHWGDQPFFLKPTKKKKQDGEF